MQNTTIGNTTVSLPSLDEAGVPVSTLCALFDRAVATAPDDGSDQKSMTLRIERISGKGKKRIRLSGEFRSEHVDQVKTKLASEDVLIAVPHSSFFPPLGRLRKEGSGYSWAPVVFTDQWARGSKATDP